MPLPLNQQSQMPQMSSAFSGWTIKMDLAKITQEIVDGFVQDVETVFSVNGVWQPLSSEQIALKPDGQRSWEWIMLHVTGNKTLFATNDRIRRNGIDYKIMGLKDYRLNNYTYYELIKDFEGSPDA